MYCDFKKIYEMKHFCYTLFALAVTLQSCRNASVSPVTATSSDSAAVDTTAFVTKNVPFSGDFSCITNMSSCRVEVTEGPCNIVYVGPEELYPSLKASVDCGVLVTSLGTERNYDTHVFHAARESVRLLISCPRLRILAHCGAGRLVCKGSIHADDLQVGTLGDGTLCFDSVYCNSMRFDINSASTTSFDYVESRKNIDIISSHSGTLCANVNVGGQLLVDDIVDSDISLTGSTHTLSINATGGGNISYTGSYEAKDIYASPKASVSVVAKP